MFFARGNGDSVYDGGPQDSDGTGGSINAGGHWRRRRNSGHVSGAVRFSIKYLQVINVYNDLVTVHSMWTGVVMGVVRTMFTDPLTAPINRPTGDHLRGITCIYY
jgi:hypothetical protein